MSTGKAAEAFRTISEVAEELDLPQHVLRFWETRFPQIKPMKRGGGRRYYRPDDVDLLRGIRYLLYVRGFTIRGVQKILKESGPRSVVAVGSGDLRAIETLPAPKAPDAVVPDMVGADDRVLIAGESETRRGGLSNLLRRERGGTGGVDERDRFAASDDASRLNAVILELLELKRLLDQVR